MARQYFKPAIGFVYLLLISTGLAQADITHYVSADGTTVYTNLSPGIDMESAPPNNAGASKATAVSEVEIYSGSNNQKSDDWANKHSNIRRIALDVETIKAARSAMLASDQVLHAARNKEFIAYDQRSQGWFDFR